MQDLLIYTWCFHSVKINCARFFVNLRVIRSPGFIMKLYDLELVVKIYFYFVWKNP